MGVGRPGCIGESPTTMALSEAGHARLAFSLGGSSTQNLHRRWRSRRLSNHDFDAFDALRARRCFWS